MNYRVGFIGGGNMAEAFISAFVEGEFLPPGNIFVSDVRPERLKELQTLYGVNTTLNNSEVVLNSDILFLAVKPQVMPAVLREIAEVVTPAQVVVSMAAGFPMRSIEALLGDDKKIARIMPNIMVKVRSGVVAYCDNSRLLDEERERVLSLLEVTGAVFRLSESLFDAVTAVAGSSPAFFFAIIEAACDGAVKVGLPRDVAKEMVLKVLEGCVKMAADEHPEVLKDRVTSPAGTTIEGLFALERGGVRASIIEAVSAACRRSKEISDLIEKSLG
ncbi:pyrroline-5-carboxylate reductase [Thermovibrio ammonificans]|uniref:Pyrroline-5-carboxylate reductase n=1 Tax=Thermovibrio ammonificans (strain DSM 15698 / JCM 12110 / HB-1) TaxID=648996 RepID=E8T2X0_THEA1|nr:pyrroline-5-carboxylate reductase [Thermovibrio ammonificans]ADU97179.1 pyrroline-5-carboxylate reductase [Thermovibrio ammonificans HB-1]